MKQLVKKKDREANKLHDKVVAFTVELKSVNEVIKTTECEKDVYRKKTHKMQKVVNSIEEDFLISENLIETLQEENKALIETISTLKAFVDETNQRY